MQYKIIILIKHQNIINRLNVVKIETLQLYSTYFFQTRNLCENTCQTQ